MRRGLEISRSEEPRGILAMTWAFDWFQWYSGRESNSGSS
jgi:hypothetical protein